MRSLLAAALLFDEQRALLGARSPLGGPFSADVSAGRAFNRRFFEARDANRAAAAEITFGPAWVLSGALSARW